MIQGAFLKKRGHDTNVVCFFFFFLFATTENYVLVISDTVIAVLLTNVSGEIRRVQIKAR